MSIRLNEQELETEMKEWLMTQNQIYPSCCLNRCGLGTCSYTMRTPYITIIYKNLSLSHSLYGHEKVNITFL